MSKTIYLIGSLRNPRIPQIGNELREYGFEVFDDWHAAGREADDEWQRYEEFRGRSYREALSGFAAAHVFHFDLFHLDRSQIGLLALPAGRSGHLELGYLRGQGKPIFILLEPGKLESRGSINGDRWDVMYKFAEVYDDEKELYERLVHELESPVNLTDIRA